MLVAKLLLAGGLAKNKGRMFNLKSEPMRPL